MTVSNTNVRQPNHFSMKGGADVAATKKAAPKKKEAVAKKKAAPKKKK